MTFKAPTLTAGQRTTFKRTKEWLINLMREIETKKTRLGELNLALAEAKSRKDKSEKDAALKPEAALTLAGAESQLSRLAPEVERLQKSLGNDTETATRQASLVRSTEVRELLFGPLIEQLLTTIAAAISPFYADGWARQFAKQLIERTDQYRQIMFYLDRPPVVTNEFEDAKREINALVVEIDQILAGGTLLEA